MLSVASRNLRKNVFFRDPRMDILSTVEWSKMCSREIVILMQHNRLIGVEKKPIKNNTRLIEEIITSQVN